MRVCFLPTLPVRAHVCALSPPYISRTVLPAHTRHTQARPYQRKCWARLLPHSSTTTGISAIASNTKCALLWPRSTEGGQIFFDDCFCVGPYFFHMVLREKGTRAEGLPKNNPDGYKKKKLLVWLHGIHFLRADSAPNETLNTHRITFWSGSCIRYRYLSVSAKKNDCMWSSGCILRLFTLG